MNRTTRTFVVLLSLCLPVVHAAGQINLLQNPGFETGALDGWASGAEPGHVVSMSAASPACAAPAPNGPASGTWAFSSSVADGVAGGTPSVSLSQSFDISARPGVVLGRALVTASGLVSGAPGCGQTSDDTAEIRIEFRDGGGILLGEFGSAPLDPVPGAWNSLVLGPIDVPSDAQRLDFHYITRLDPGFASIDILADDFFLEVSCLADWDGDDIVNTGDFLAYLNDYNAARSGGVPIFDDPDLVAPFGVLNTSDFLAFLNAFASDC